MNLRGGASKGSPFVASNLLLPHVPPIKEPLAIVALRVPGFLPARSFYRFGWAELLGTALSRYPVSLRARPGVLFIVAEIPSRHRLMARSRSVQRTGCAMRRAVLVPPSFPLAASRIDR
jgi:hypothetical protein